MPSIGDHHNVLCGKFWVSGYWIDQPNNAGDTPQRSAHTIVSWALGYKLLSLYVWLNVSVMRHFLCKHNITALPSSVNLHRYGVFQGLLPTLMIAYVGLDLGVDTSVVTNSVTQESHLRKPLGRKDGYTEQGQNIDSTRRLSVVLNIRRDDDKGWNMGRGGV